MALSRVYQRIFGINGLSTQFGKIGSLAAGTPQTTADPSVMQSLANYLGGWFDCVLGGSAVNGPAIEDRNALDFVITRQLAYIFQAGISEWDNQTEYEVGSMVNVAGATYISIQAVNVNHAVTDQSWWRLPGGVFRTVSSVGPALATDDVVLCDPTSGSFQLTIPDCNNVPIGKVLVIKNIATNANFVQPTCVNYNIDFAHSYQNLLSGESLSIRNSGAVWWVL